MLEAKSPAKFPIFAEISGSRQYKIGRLREPANLIFIIAHARCCCRYSASLLSMVNVDTSSPLNLVSMKVYLPL